MYLVTGGVDGSNDFLSSTETLVDGELIWSEVGQLPEAMRGLRGVSLNNNIFMLLHQILHNYQQ